MEKSEWHMSQLANFKYLSERRLSSVDLYSQSMEYYISVKDLNCSINDLMDEVGFSVFLLKQSQT